MKYVETNEIELKEKMTDELKKEIIAFLNANGGTIYVGVTDAGETMPFKDNSERDDMDVRLSNWIRDVFYPNASGLLNYYFDENGIFVIEIKPGLDKPYYLKEKGPKPSGVYVRIGTTSRMATESEILLMLLDSRKYSYEEDISEEKELTFNFFNEMCEKNKVSHEERNLRSLRMINKDGEYTNLAFMLSDQSDIVVKFAKYDKNLNFTTKKEFKGSILKILENVLESADNYNDVSAVISRKSWQRIETISYPGASLREGILNAFCHSNYFIRSNIKIEFFDDKVKITNPGGIYQATLEQIMDGVQTYRNPGLVNILNKLHYIENFGTGIPRILQAYDGFSRQPIFNPSGNFFILTLPNQNYVDLESDLESDLENDLETISANNLDGIDAEILLIVSQNPGIKSLGIFEKIKKTYPHATIDIVKNNIKRKLTNYIEFKGSQRSGGFYIKK